MSTSTSPASSTASGRTTGPAASGTAPALATGPFAGWLPLTRLALRRDRVLIPVWLAVFVVTAAGTAASTLDVYPTEASRRGIAATINATASMRALYGPIFDEGSAGAVSLFKMGTFGAALVAVLAIIMTVRHTRAEEEAGRLELVRAGVVGRYASLTAALSVVVLTNVALAVLLAVSLVGTGLPAAGSVAFGLSWGLSGIAYATVAAIAAQLTTVARAATGLSVSVLGATYLLRAVGDTSQSGGTSWLSWLSPVGWSQQLRPFAGDRWWAAAISVVFAVLATTCAFVLVGGRDVGAGVLPDRPGPRTAGRWLGSTEGLALRLHRGTLIAWTGAFLLLGSVLGGIVANVGDAFSSEGARELVTRLGGAGALVDAYLATVISFIGVFVSAFGVAAVLRLHGEESLGHGDPLLSTPVTRTRWAMSHVLVAVLGSAWLLVVGGAAAGLSTATGTGDDARFGQILAATLVQIPAVLVLVGITTAAVGLAPRYAVPVSWGALVAFLLIGEVGPLIRLNHWVMDLSPFAHTPHLPAEAFTATPLVWLTTVGLGLLAVGLEAFRRRDIQ
jgi:ABC-2 type transport system permease protein